MKILLTGATGYIGKRLLPVLIKEGYFVICCVRDKSRFKTDENISGNITIVEADFLNKESLRSIPKDIDAAFYLIHSMSSGFHNFDEEEKLSAENFRDYISETNVKHVIYLSGIINEKKLSKHLSSRKKVEEILAFGKYNFTTLRAGIIIGSGSASFEIIRDLVEKLPVMITPKWLNTKAQPIAIRDVILLLKKTLFNENTYGQNYDIGGKEILTYKEMLLQFAKIRKLKRAIFTLPVMTPRLSSYWLYFVTAVSYPLAVNLVNSMKVEVICKGNNLLEMLNVKPLSYTEAISRAFDKIEHNEIISSWKDSLISGRIENRLSSFIQVPTNGCFKYRLAKNFKNRNIVLKRIWSIGGDTGWYYGDWLWKIRGFIDKLFGSVGLRRGRTSSTEINSGDALDFWRVLLADKSEGRLLLFAEMKLPGEAWLEFKIEGDTLIQEATFRPRGLLGRMYWYASMPFHFFIFEGMAKEITK